MFSRSPLLFGALSLLALVACKGNKKDAPAQTSQATSAIADAGARRHHVEAVEVCQGKGADAPCTVTFGDKTLTGRCVSPPPGVSDTRLSCRPAPPAAVFEACKGKAIGEACGMKFGARALNGTCAPPPPGDPETRLGCRPDTSGASGAPPEAYAGCVGKAADSDCVVATLHGELQGTCHAGPPGGDPRLVCRPRRSPPANP